MGEASAAATTLIVSPGGSDSAPGTLARPLRTIQRAVDLAVPGDTIAVRGGTYALTDNITLTTSGTASLPLTLGAYQGERVVIDGEQLPASHTPVGGSIPRAERGAIHKEASYWRISDLEIVNGPYGVYCDGCNGNVFARLKTHDNYESGFQLQGASSDNQILNLDSYANRDPRKNGESADGLAIKEGSGTGNVVRGRPAVEQRRRRLRRLEVHLADHGREHRRVRQRLQPLELPRLRGRRQRLQARRRQPGPAVAHTCATASRSRTPRTASPTTATPAPSP